MRKLFVLLVVIGAVSMAFVKKDAPAEPLADGTGIKFKGMSLEEAKAEAKASGKIIFIDAYTEWCGPCKRMAATTFMDDKVADLFNSKFINLKIEMEKSADGPNVARAYGVKVYPTLLFIDAQGVLKKQALGLQTADQLLALGKSL
ncbi:MAG: Thioredoxin protein [Crocinitomicaceae bacterium]|jgi:thiol:disulfide interchange protein|nr:Thioredoxin protein [Crocinitomicaceae bacterium]